MRYIDSRSIGAISSIAAIGLGTSLVTGSGMFSLLFGSKKDRKLSKSQRKKIARRRYRRFVDNIVMHHKRLHDRNREITIKIIKSRILDKHKKKAKQFPVLAKEPQIKWQDRFDSKGKASSMRERIEARRVRARSRWLTVSSLQNQSENPKNPENPNPNPMSPYSENPALF